MSKIKEEMLGACTPKYIQEFYAELEAQGDSKSILSLEKWVEMENKMKQVTEGSDTTERGRDLDERMQESLSERAQMSYGYE